MATLIDDLEMIATPFCAARQLSIARVSTLVFNDGSKLGHLLDGTADVTTRRYERAILWFSDNWPADIPWPADIERPKRSAGPAASQAGAGSLCEVVE